MQVGDDDGQSVERVGVGEQVVVRRALLVRARDHRLQRQVAGLDQVTGGLRRLGADRPVRAEGGDHEGVAAGAQPAVEGGDVQQDAVADLRSGHQVGVRERADAGAGVVAAHVQLDRSPPAATHAGHAARGPHDHPPDPRGPSTGVRLSVPAASVGP